MIIVSAPTLPCSLSDDELARLIHEDVPYLDLTTYALGIGDAPGRMSFTARQSTVIAGTEEVGRLLTLCGATMIRALAAGSRSGQEM